MRLFSQECTMRRTHQETQELVAARCADFVAGDANEDVLKASLKALGLDRDEINFECWKAAALKEKARTHGAKAS